MSVCGSFLPPVFAVSSWTLWTCTLRLTTALSASKPHGGFWKVMASPGSIAHALVSVCVRLEPMKLEAALYRIPGNRDYPRGACVIYKINNEKTQLDHWESAWAARPRMTFPTGLDTGTRNVMRLL